MKPISYSELQCWIEDPKEWERRYVLGLVPKATEAMNLGTSIHQWLQGNQDEVITAHALSQSWRQGWEQAKLNEYQWEYEKEIIFPIGDIPCVAYLDGYDERRKTLLEIKTGSQCWTPKRMSQTRQWPFYLLIADAARLPLKRGLLFTLSTKTGKTKLMQFNQSWSVTTETYQQLSLFKEWLKVQKLEDARLERCDRFQV